MAAEIKLKISFAWRATVGTTAMALQRVENTIGNGLEIIVLLVLLVLFMANFPAAMMSQSVAIKTTMRNKFPFQLSNSLLYAKSLIKMPAHPDSDIYPEATGPAKVLVDKHSAKQPLKLYAGWFCPCVYPSF